MKRLKLVFEEYLKGIGRFAQTIDLGREEIEPRPVTEKDSQFLTAQLNRQYKANNNMIIIATTMLVILFVLGVFLVFYYLDSPKIISVVFGGTFLSLLSIISRLHKLWIEKNMMDVSLIILQTLTPEQAAQFFKELYWNKIRQL